MLFREDISEHDVVSPERRYKFRGGLRKLLGINLASLALSVTNEVYFGHSALGFNQAGMELVDSGLVVGLNASEKRDAAAKFKRASHIRQGLYAAHILIAGVGIAEAGRLIDAGAEPSAGNIAVSGIVGVMNGHYIYHRMQHMHHEAHTPTTALTYETAMNDPLEVIQDEMYGLPNAEEVHKMNDNGTTAIAWTNVAESGGGMIGAGLQIMFQQGGAVAAIASSVAVVGIMGRQIWRERSLMKQY